MDKNQILKSYKDKLLGIRLYDSQKKEFYSEDFLNIETLSCFLDELSCSESDITPAGKAFLGEYYGFSDLALLLQKGSRLKEDIKELSIEDLANWLRDTEPMITSTFINDCRKKSNNDIV